MRSGKPRHIVVGFDPRHMLNAIEVDIIAKKYVNIMQTSTRSFMACMRKRIICIYILY